MASSKNTPTTACNHCASNALRAFSYPEELAQKTLRLREELEAAGISESFPDLALPEVKAAPAREGYRSSAKLVFGFDKQAGKAMLGIYRPGSHALVDLEHCLDHHPDMQPVLAWVKEAVVRHGLPVYHEGRRKGFLRYFLLKVLTGGRMLAAFVTPHDEGAWQEKLLAMASEMASTFPQLRVVSQNINPTTGNTVLGNKSIHLEGQHSVPCRFLETSVPVGPYTFLQSNLAVFDQILTRIKAWLDMAGGEEQRVADLYCGCGAIGRSVTRNHPLFLLESEAHSQTSMVEGAREDGREEITAMRGRVEDSLVSLELFEPDVIVVDPPRKGLAPELLEALFELKAKRIAYLSCNPRTQCRDLKALGAHYHVESLEAWDMMPGTPHMESLALLCRKDLAG